MRTRRFGGRKASVSVRVNLRLDESEQVAIDRWRDEHAKWLTRAEAIRHLVRLGLGTADVRLAEGTSPRDKAAKLADKQLDCLEDPSATPEQRTNRKERLLEGPEEFRVSRANQRKSR